MISSRKALSIIKKNVFPLKSEYVESNQALGRVVFKNIKANMSSPPFNCSSMDGFAININKNHNNKTYEVVDEIFAGNVSKLKIKNGQAVKVYTGSMLPVGCNAVIIQEEVIHKKSNRIEVNTKIKKFQFIRKKGKDFLLNQIILKKNKRISAKDIALLISANCKKIRVYKKPRVAIFSTGNELITSDSNIKAGKIFASSIYMLEKMTELSYCICSKIEILKDDEKEIKNALQNLKNIDLIITTGGVSVGKKDLIKNVLKKIKFERKFWKIAVLPGKPLLFGTLNKVPLFGLPGNPVSSYISFLLFVKVAIYKLNNQYHKYNIKKVTLLNKIPENGKREAFLRGKLKKIKNKYYVKALRDQDSSLLYNLSLSNCLINIKPLQPNLNKGNTVDVIKLPFSL